MSAESPMKDHRVRVAAERRARRRSHLCDAALRVMADRGTEGASIDAIVQEAGVARGTFYKYYESPSDLIRSVGIELAQDLILAMRPFLDRHDDPAIRLSHGFRMVLTLVRQHPVVGRFLVRAGWPQTDTVQSFSDRVVANIAAGLERGRFRTMHLSVAKAMVGGLSIGMMAVMVEPDAPPELEQEAAQTLLVALGLPHDEALRISSLALEPPVIPAEGLLARAMAWQKDVG